MNEARRAGLLKNLQRLTWFMDAQAAKPKPCSTLKKKRATQRPAPRARRGTK